MARWDEPQSGERVYRIPFAAIAGVVAGLVSGGMCVWAGAYLLSKSSGVATELGEPWLSVIAHGLGLFMIGVGVFAAALLVLRAVGR